MDTDKSALINTRIYSKQKKKNKGEETKIRITIINEPNNHKEQPSVKINEAFPKNI